MSIFKKYFKWVLGIAAGALAGLLYWRFIGCNSGSCPISSNPYMSMFWFGLIGFLLVPSNKKGAKRVNRQE
ncbi:hypothetical protein [Acetobacteroides hydrogenigenes]|uniref:YtxH domain-containing protein n=1 Tax=Acetobacteroides hydrogenigenes TaxID=979970 RepID=A0A4R2F151_9BACT|nr:hypothetical protein [Acetobacteroides hydrogenigenes]TCN73055.1 hypothetical protein CLV25_101273 [Acetobacteroides hydrogenigenes]